MTSTISNRASLFEVSPTPQESKQWKITLQGIKLLYIQRQYKRCVARSSAILNTTRGPVSGDPREPGEMSTHERTTRSTQSTEPISTFTVPFHTKQWVAVLPDAIPLGRDDPQTPSYTSLGESSSASDLSDTLSPTESLVSCITDIIDKSLDCAEDDPFLSDGEGDGDVYSCIDIGDIISVFDGKPDEKSLVPSPLHVRKPSPPLNLTQGCIHYTDQTAKTPHHTNRPGRVRAPPPLPIKVVPFEASGQYPAKIKFIGAVSMEPSQRFVAQKTEPDTPQLTPSCEAAITSYNSSIEFLHTQINSSIYSIHRLIDEVAELRQARKASKNFQRSASFWSFNPVNEAPSTSQKDSSLEQPITKETMEDRIVRLRTQGWKTVGLKSAKRGWKGAAYYKAYCGSVLDELYLEA